MARRTSGQARTIGSGASHRLSSTFLRRSTALSVDAFEPIESFATKNVSTSCRHSLGKPCPSILRLLRLSLLHLERHRFRKQLLRAAIETLAGQPQHEGHCQCTGAHHRANDRDTVRGCVNNAGLPSPDEPVGSSGAELRPPPWQALNWAGRAVILPDCSLF